MARLLAKTGGLTTQAHELKPGINLIGRSPTNDIQINEYSVSSLHCEVWLSGEKVKVCDLGSTNGTFVDGQRVTEALISPGQTLQLGGVALLLELEPPRVAIPELSKPEQIVPTFLPDGSPACLNHPETRAAFTCQKCQGLFCEDCVRILGLKGRTKTSFCPACTGQCDPFVWQDPAKKKKSLLGRLTQTLRLPFSKRS